MPEAVTAAIREEVRREAGFDPAASTGLFVGVSVFEYSASWSLQFPVDDAIDLAHLFSVELELLHPSRVVLALAGEPRKTESRERLSRLLELGATRAGARRSELRVLLARQAKASGEKGLLLVFAATHGFLDQGRHFLAASDSLPQDIPDTGLAVGKLLEEASRAPAPRRVLLLDTCREPLFKRTRSVADRPLVESLHEAIGSSSGLLVLHGAPFGGVAAEDPERGNGVFTAALLEGLRGAAPADPRGFITAGSLADFVQRRVTEGAEKKAPGQARHLVGVGTGSDRQAETLPLAVHLELSRARDRYRERRGAALSRLRENFGKIVTGALYDHIAALLPEEPPVSDREEALLEEIEALDGSVRVQRSLRAYALEVLRVTEQEGNGETKVSGQGGSSEETPTLREFLDLVLREFGFSRWFTVSQAGAALIRSRSQAGPSAFSLGIITGVVAGAIVVAVSAFLLSRPIPPPSSEKGDISAGSAHVNEVGMRFRYVPAGSYTISSPKHEPGRWASDAPPHEVRLTRGFWLGETEVTQEQWVSLDGDITNPSYFKACGGDCPVERVSWFEAVTFANLLSEKEGVGPCYDLLDCKGDLGTDSYTCEGVRFKELDCPGYRLPTEAEWEVAALAGTFTAIYTGELTLRGERNGPELDPISWYGGNSGVKYESGWDCSEWKEKQYTSERCGTHAVRGKKENPWGFHDMLGNVWEWTWDVWQPGLSTAPDVDPLGPDQSENRVFRGGSWSSHARDVRAAYHDHSPPSRRDFTLGFRLARSQVRSSPAEPDSQ